MQAYPALCLWQSWNFLDETAKDKAERAKAKQRRSRISAAHDVPISMRHTDRPSGRTSCYSERIPLCNYMYSIERPDLDS